jgi:hypothetical protein
MNCNFKSAVMNLLQKIRPHKVPVFGNDLKRCFDSERVIDVHQGGTEVAACSGLHIVSHHGRRGGAIRPKPDKRNPPSIAGLKRKQEQLLMKVVDRAIYGPPRKLDLPPIPEMKFLQMSPDLYGESRPD